MRSTVVRLAVAVWLLTLAPLKASPTNAAVGCCVSHDPTVSEAAVETRTVGVAEPAAEPPHLPAPLDLGAEGLAVGKAYQDVFRVLKDDNSCSRFFGGPRTALTVLNKFARRLRLKPLGQSHIALRMSGDYTTYHDQRTDVWYRIFDEVTVNTDGPFSPQFELPRGWRSQVGRFPVETRAAKTLMLLHELGHLIKGPDAQWLLPNDGHDPALSGRNTREVQSRCLWQLLTLQV